MQYALNIKFNERDGENGYEKKILFLNNKWRSFFFNIIIEYIIGPTV